MMGVYNKHTKHVSVHPPARLERTVRVHRFRAWHTLCCADSQVTMLG